MDRILYKTREIKEDSTVWTIKYYITNLKFFGIEITSTNGEKRFVNHISNIFTYKKDAENFLDFLYDNEASPISMPYLAEEYIENNFLSDNLKCY